MSEEFPRWSIGEVHGIDTAYDVHWLERDLAQLTVDGEEIVTFSSAQAVGFTTMGGVLDEAAEVIFQLEEVDPWGNEDEW